MPFKETTIGSAFLMLIGEKLCAVSEIPEFTDTTTESAEEQTAVMHLRDVGLSFTGITHITKWFKNFLTYGWRAKGPVRKRLLKALKMKYPKYFTVICSEEMAENG